MARFHNQGGTRVQFTAEEETARDAEELAWNNEAPNSVWQNLEDKEMPY